MNNQFPKGFGSDNHAGAHPELLQALVDCNTGHAPSYGTDFYCKEAHKKFEEAFARKLDVFFVFNGTAANTLALKSLTQSYESIFCAEEAHAYVDECGAPEFFTGGKLIPLSSQNGKIKTDALEKNLIRFGDQHFSQPKTLTITQPTELGTLYTKEELKNLCQVAKDKGMFVHLDGARLSNAIVSLETNFADFFKDLPIDVISFGGTKNGFVFGEAVVFLNQSLSKNFKFIRKQGLNLPSKSRFIAAQFLRYFKDDLWKKIAHHENQMAARLSQKLQDIPEIKITRPVQANAVFAQIPKNWVKPLRQSHFFYIWDENTFEARLMCCFDTSAEDILEFAQKARSLSEGEPHDEIPPR